MSSKQRAREISAGGVVVRGEPGREQTVVIVPTRRAGDDGSLVLALPKGHIDPGESPIQAAVREVREETGIVVAAEPLSELGESRYFYRRDGRTVGKSVTFFLLAYVDGDTADHDEEVLEARWIDLRAALAEAQLRRRAQDDRVAWLTSAPLPRVAKTDSLPVAHAGPQLRLDHLRRRAPARAQDRDHPPRRQVGQVPQEPGRARHDRLPVLPPRTDLRSGHRPGRGDAPGRPLPATSSTTTPSSAATRSSSTSSNRSTAARSRLKTPSRSCASRRSWTSRRA